MKNIIEYIEKVYKPITIIVYGSYSDASNNKHSDFDAIVVSDDCDLYHDVSFIDGVQLDLFIYPKSFFESNVDFSKFTHLFHSNIIKDTDNYGTNLVSDIVEYVENLKCKTIEELKTDISWCNKMLIRIRQNDIDGMYRWHLLLVESLEIFCSINGKKYFGPKKTLKWMATEYPKAYEYYKGALFNLEIEELEKWINYLSKMI